MKIHIDGKHRTIVKVMLVVFPFFSIVLAFFTLPLQVSIPISLIFTVCPLILERFIFTYKVIHFMPMPTEGMLVHRLGTTWFTQNTETMEGLGFTVVFKYKSVAKDAYNMFKAWNFGKVIDHSENITFRAVRELDGKYSAFLYAGDRSEILELSENLAKERHGDKSIISMEVTKYYMQFGFNYSDSELKTKCIESLPLVDELNLNVGYVDNGEIKLYSKRGFRLKNFSLKNRSDVPEGTIESLSEWIDPTGKLAPINQAVVDLVNSKLPSNKKN